MSRMEAPPNLTSSSRFRRRRRRLQQKQEEKVKEEGCLDWIRSGNKEEGKSAAFARGRKRGGGEEGRAGLSIEMIYLY